MPTVFSHAIVATALGQWFPSRRLPGRFWAWTVLCAVIPDADVIGFSFGIQYDDMLGHRGLTHSLPFALLMGYVVAQQFPKRLATDPSRVQLVIWFAAVTASHGLLDALTNGGRGIAFLAPVSNYRFFFPWRPIQVSPIGVRFFSARGLDVLASEFLWILLPSAIMAVLARAVAGSRRNAAPSVGRRTPTDAAAAPNRSVP